MTNGEAPHTKPKPRVLLVDNDPDVRASLAANTLEPAGYEVLLARSAAEAQDKLRETLVHLAIVDVRLENDKDENDDSGLRLCRDMEPTVPRLLLTSQPNWRLTREALGLGHGPAPLAQGVIAKGDDELKLLLEEVRRVLEAEFEVLPDRRIAVLTSGGDSPGMNAALWSVVHAAMRRGVEVLGVDDGYRGLHRGWLHKLTWNAATPTLTQGGTFLGTARFDEFKDPRVRKIAVDNLVARHVSGLVVIGGDGSMNGAAALANDVRARAQDRLFKTVAIPGTIDNDLFGTEWSLGAATAINAIARELRAMIAPASALRRIFVCEVMGRYSGFLAIEAALAIGADVVLVPEQSVILHANSAPAEYWTKRVDELGTYSKFLEHLKDASARLRDAFRPGNPKKRHAFVIVAEGVRKLVGEAADVEHIAAYLANHVKAWGQPDPPDVRSQVLGYPVRGASPCHFDVLLGLRLGERAVECLLDPDRKRTEVMVGLAPDGSIQETPFKEVVEKSNRPPAEVWADRPRWQERLQLHEMLTRLPPPIF